MARKKTGGKRAGKKPRMRRALEKRIDNCCYLTGRRRGGILKEEVWCEGDQVVKYSLAYINSNRCGADHGRVLGYDNAHEVHHRHWMGEVTRIDFRSYEVLAQRFQREVEALWRSEDEEEG